MTATLCHYVNGASVEGTSGRFGHVFNPATGEVAARVPLASGSETAGAIAAANAAFPAWRDTPPLRRAAILFRFKELLDLHADEVAQLIADEHGKVLSDARGSLTRGIEVVEFACGAPPSQGDIFGERRPRCRQPLCPPAPRRLCRHHAVQFSGDGPDVDVPDGDRMRERLRAQDL